MPAVNEELLRSFIVHLPEDVDCFVYPINTRWVGLFISDEYLQLPETNTFLQEISLKLPLMWVVSAAMEVLAQLETDWHRRISKENSILFPRDITF